ncbi:MAG: YdcF family protein [Bryobacteraceae bacterium]
MRKIVAVVRNGLALFGLLFVVVSATPLTQWWARKLAGDWPQSKAEVVVVLGGGLLDTGVIGHSSYWRAVYGMMAWREGGFKEVVVTGGGKPAVSVVMREFLVGVGVPREAIRVEVESTSTRQNAVETAKLLAGRKAVLVTSDFHMYRALRAFRKAGADVEPRPLPHAIKMSQTWWWRWISFVELVGETVKIGYYSARGWM